MKKNKSKKELLKINLFTTFLIIGTNAIAFMVNQGGKDSFITISFYITGIILFIYLLLLSDKIKSNLTDLKSESLYINYPLSISIFLVFLFLVLIASAICLVVVNKDAANITFIFTFFMTTISMLFPSILLCSFIYFIVPAFIIPSVTNKKNKNYKFLIITLLIIFLIFCLFKGIKELTRISNIQNQNKYKSAKLTINYSTDFLKYNNIDNYDIKKMSLSKVKVPFYYTTDAIPFDEFYEAENFCASMSAKIPNQLEIYHIIFNKFDTFGEKYYWTSYQDNNNNSYVLHFKNMSYEIIKKPKNIAPLTYCIANSNSDFGLDKKGYFYRNVIKERSENLKKLTDKPFDLEGLKEFAGIEQKNNKIFEEPKKEDINTDKKHVSFSVKEVSREVFSQLLQKGYSYNPNIKINDKYETNEAVLNTKILNNTNNIRLCFYPFSVYENMSITQESQIWKQSFCSPAFELINQTPVVKTRYDKEAYCMANGGRVPNIPELNGILRSLGINYTGKKYWINNRIFDFNSNSQKPVYVEFNNSRFMTIKSLNSNENEQAYVYCIKNAKIPSKVIANYKSRFKGIEGQMYAKEKCPTCLYYEVPDTILE